MQHAVLYRDESAYSPWPVLWQLPGGSIGAGVVTSPVGSHPGASVFGRFLAFVSRDRGSSWDGSGASGRLPASGGCGASTAAR